MPATGRPIGGACDGARPSQNQAVAYTVASVGPYRLAIRQDGMASRMSRTVWAGSASPASTTVRARTAGGSSPSSRENTEGTPLSSPRARGRPPGSVSASRSRTTSTLPPASSGQRISKTDTSKLSEVEATTSVSRSRPSSASAQAASPATPLWVATTPLGRPVDPEV
ncbi:hypothetical protein GCM10009680_34180 [Streptomyces yatensis]|uniref:Uncharacterized protein n=1 Tax=Streptomyces yatensis TaxID=155177 RepID=A0ABP4TQ41_9ACTN